MFKKDLPVLYKKNCAVIQEFDGDKIVVKFQVSPATPTGKKAQYATQKVREKDIIALSEKPCTSLEKLLDFSDAKISEQIKEAHELLLSDEATAAAEITFSELTEILRGTCSPDESWFLFNALTDSVEFELSEDALKSGKIIFIPRNQEQINAINKKKYEKEHEQEIHVAFIERL